MWQLDGGASITYDGMDRKERLRHRREIHRIARETETQGKRG